MRYNSSKTDPLGIFRLFLRLMNWIISNWKRVFIYVFISCALMWAWLELEGKPIWYAKILGIIIQSLFIAVIVKLLFEENIFLEQKKCCEHMVKPLKDSMIERIMSKRGDMSQDDYKSIFEDDGPIKIFCESINDLANGTIAPDYISLIDIIKHSSIKSPFKLIFIDPYSLGAGLSSANLNSSHFQWKEGFSSDEMKKIHDLNNSLRNQINKVSFDASEIRFCRSFMPPFMIISKNYALFQPNLLCGGCAIQNSTYLPQFQYIRKKDNFVIFEQLQSHFDKIWDNDCVALDDVENGCIGIDYACKEKNIFNIYIPRSSRKSYDPINRMRYLISSTKEILWIKHVSMFVLLSQQGLLYGPQNGYKGIIEHIKNIKDVRLLLIDPYCEQAKMRSYKEYIMQGLRPTASYNEFIQIVKDEHGNDTSIFFRERLYSDTMSSINKAKSIKSIMDGDSVSINNLYSVRKYSSAPDSALFITDTSALFEPLHYGVPGKIFQTDSSSDNANKKMPILSGEMPLFEFKRRKEAGVSFDENDRAGSYDMMKNNFEFVYDQYSEVVV